MAKDARKIEVFLAEFARSHGIAVTGFHGELYLGVCSTVDAGDRIEVRPGDDNGGWPKSAVVSISSLARELAEFTT